MGLLVDEALQPDQLQQLEHPGLALAAGHAPQPQRQLDVLAHRQPGEQRGLLEHQAGLAAPHDLTGRGVVEPGDQVEQRGLAAAGRTDQADELPGADLERDAVEGEDGVVPAPEPLADGVEGHTGIAIHGVEGPRFERGGTHAPDTSGWSASLRTWLSRVRS